MSNMILIFVMIGTMIGCADHSLINLSRHHSGKSPTKIVWLQIAGFDESHISDRSVV